MATDDPDINLEIIANTYRYLSDDDAWDVLLESWARKLKAAETSAANHPVDSDKAIKSHLEQIKKLLDRKASLPLRNSIEETVSVVR